MRFETDTRVERIDDTHWRCRIAEGWDIGSNANGGYLLALVGRVLGEATGRPDPVSVTAHYLSPGKAGEAVVECHVVRAGRRFATASATLTSGGKAVLQVLGTYSDLTQTEGPERVDASPPQLPPPDDCTLNRSEGDIATPFMQRVDLRLHPEDSGFRVGDPSGEPRVRGWFRLPDAEVLDSVGLLLAVDAFPPTAFNAKLPLGWVPTLELTAHVRARPAPGWLRCAFETRFVTGGFLEEDGEIWDETGRLVAQSRQLALAPRLQS
jgi:acyl-CoA thioesterase